MRNEVDKWIAQARADLKTAQDNLASGNYYVVALLCQQALEKGLTALHLRVRDSMPPRTHSLAYLSGLVNLPLSLTDAIDVINPGYSIVIRPDMTRAIPSHIYTRTSATHILAQAEVVFAWIEDQL